jgi:hypothetical protein
MIDRKTALICAVLIGLMLASAVWRITVPYDWAFRAVQNRTPLLPLPLPLFVFPAASALFVGCLYWSSFRARADTGKVQPWYRWGKLFSLGYCGCVLLLQGVLVAQSLGLNAPLPLPVVGRAVSVLLMIISLLAINQMPKLPYFERRFSPGGDLGPIYGPRYMRTVSRFLIIFVIVVFAFSFAVTPTVGRRVALIILLAAALLAVCGIVWRRHLGRKWSLEQGHAG